VIGLSLPGWATERPGAISGYVRNAAGEPQMGAIVEILGAANRSLTVFSDGAGYYIATGLLPGLYTIKVTAPSFLPALHEKIGVRAGGSIHINVTLNTLMDVMQLGPTRPLPDNDDWKWTLRSVANRPILRVFDDPTLASEKPSHELRGTLSFLAGSTGEGYGSGSDMATGFMLERNVFSDGQLSFSGAVAYGSTMPASTLRAGYTHHVANGSEPSITLTARRFAPADDNLHNAALQALSFGASDDFTFGNVLELKFGSELQTIQFLGEMSAFRPYGSADLHLSPNTVVEYAYTTSRPDLQCEKGFDSAPAEFSESNPRVSLSSYNPMIESAHHQELSLSRRLGNTNLQLAVFSDRVAGTALTGVGDVTSIGGYLLPDLTSGTFNYTGGTVAGNGMRFVLQHKFSSDLTATLDYAFGDVLDLSRPDVPLQQAQQFLTSTRRHAVAAKLSGHVPHARTQWVASYRWVNGQALTPVDMFNAAAGQSQPFLNLVIRQPIPSMGFLPGHMEALIDVRNLLAQGYVPVIGQDGETVYLVQSARSIRGGLAFTF
jgi:hypothetical protein